MLYLQLFITFFKIGLFGFGGGYAMLSLIQRDIVEVHGWLTSAEFADIVAISQMTPGPIGINSATFVGYATTGSIWGAALATFALVLPSFAIMLTICRFLVKFKNNAYFEAVFTGIRPVVVGLIASAALMLMNKENFIDYKSYIIFIVAFLSIWKFKMNPILMIILAGIAGVILY